MPFIRQSFQQKIEFKFDNFIISAQRAQVVAFIRAVHKLCTIWSVDKLLFIFIYGSIVLARTHTVHRRESSVIVMVASHFEQDELFGRFRDSNSRLSESSESINFRHPNCDPIRVGRAVTISQTETLIIASPN